MQVPNLSYQSTLISFLTCILCTRKSHSLLLRISSITVSYCIFNFVPTSWIIVVTLLSIFIVSDLHQVSPSAIIIKFWYLATKTQYNSLNFVPTSWLVIQTLLIFIVRESPHVSPSAISPSPPPSLLPLTTTCKQVDVLVNQSPL